VIARRRPRQRGRLRRRSSNVFTMRPGGLKNGFVSQAVTPATLPSVGRLKRFLNQSSLYDALCGIRVRLPP
jgi:hypothetical protein